MDHARNERYARIRVRAGEIWQLEGCPGNQHERHWLLAMRQIDREDDAVRGRAPSALAAKRSATVTPRIPEIKGKLRARIVEKPTPRSSRV